MQIQIQILIEQIQICLMLDQIWLNERRLLGLGGVCTLPRVFFFFFGDLEESAFCFPEIRRQTSPLSQENKSCLYPEISTCFYLFNLETPGRILIYNGVEIQNS